jgi:hypothetical protein
VIRCCPFGQRNGEWFALTGLPECTPAFQNAVFERTKGSGAEVIKKKEGLVGL